MADVWRAGIKTSQVGSEEFLFLEFRIERSFVVSKKTAAKYLNQLVGAEFADVRSFLLSFMNSEQPPGKLVGAKLPWRPLIMANETLHNFADLAMLADRDVTFRCDGGVNAGVSSLVVTLGGRAHSYDVRSSTQGRILADELQAFKTNLETITVVQAGKVKTVIGVVEKILDWLFRMIQAWETYEAAQQAREAAEAAEREAREFKEKLESLEFEPMDYDNESQLDSIGRTA